MDQVQEKNVRIKDFIIIIKSSSFDYIERDLERLVRDITMNNILESDSILKELWVLQNENSGYKDIAKYVFAVTALILGGAEINENRVLPGEYKISRYYHAGYVTMKDLERIRDEKIKARAEEFMLRYTSYIRQQKGSF